MLRSSFVALYMKCLFECDNMWMLRCFVSADVWLDINLHSQDVCLRTKTIIDSLRCVKPKLWNVCDSSHRLVLWHLQADTGSVAVSYQTVNSMICVAAIVCRLSISYAVICFNSCAHLPRQTQATMRCVFVTSIGACSGFYSGVRSDGMSHNLSLTRPLSKMKYYIDLLFD